MAPDASGAASNGNGTAQSTSDPTPKKAAAPDSLADNTGATVASSQLLSTSEAPLPDDIHTYLRGLRADEVVVLARNPIAQLIAKHVKVPKETLASLPAAQFAEGVRHRLTTSSWSSWFVVPLQLFLQYMVETWSYVAGLTFELTWSKRIPFTDLVLNILFSALASTILFFALFWCQFANFPPINWLYYRFANQYAHGLGLVNAANPDLFSALTHKQIEAAKIALRKNIAESEDTEKLRVFDLDIAKLLLQFASVVYERNPAKALAPIRLLQPGVLQPGIEQTTSVSSASAQRTQNETQSAPTPDSLAATSAAEGVNNNDLKRSKSAVSAVTNGTATTGDSDGDGSDPQVAKPGKLAHAVYGNAVGRGFLQAVRQSQDDGSQTIRDFTERIKCDWEAVSELNNAASAFCSFFWEPKENWIVVCFKGTGIVEYSDWISDLTVRMVDGHDFIPGYGKFIKGFLDRIYPSKVEDIGQSRPYDTIRDGLIVLARYLVRQNERHNPNWVEGTKINVWFTGHSLGCSLATLTYARAISVREDFAEAPIVIRDAYIFAAPVSGDRPSATEFARWMNEKVDGRLRTMWRVTNYTDAVATALPELGDDPNRKLSPTNPAGFAHMGAEIKMEDRPILSRVTGSEFFGPSAPDSLFVEIRSALKPEEIREARRERMSLFGGMGSSTTTNGNGGGFVFGPKNPPRRGSLDEFKVALEKEKNKARIQFGRWAERIPGIGRFIAHDTVLYWDQLESIGTGTCTWIKATS